MTRSFIKKQQEQSQMKIQLIQKVPKISKLNIEYITPRVTKIAKFQHHEFQLSSGTLGFENKQGVLYK